MGNGHFTGCQAAPDCSCEAIRYQHILWLAALAFTVFLVGGVVSGSVALLAGAADAVADGAAIAVNLVVARLARDGYDKRRVRAIGGLTGSMLLGGMALAVLFEAISRFGESHLVSGPSALLASSIGLVVNVCQWHLHAKAEERERHINHKVFHWHLVFDIVVSVGVLVSAALIVAGIPSTLDTVVGLLAGGTFTVLAARLAFESVVGNHAGHHH